MTDYADRIAAQLVHPSPPQIPVAQVLVLIAAGVRAGYILRDGVGK